ncbi:MAG: class I SAM-dependent methyltransferase [Rhodospirillales bacterium]|nr:class I SAM-dependent methyltransferase [Rhodospirillales bacterium]
MSLVMQVRWLGGVRQLATAEPGSDPHLAAVHNYNAGVTAGKIITSTRRPETIYRIAGLLARPLGRDRLLIVGPRNVQELLVAWIHGFAWRNVEAIDLYSTHPRIRTMDMHRLEYPDGSFGVVTMVNTLGYASDIPAVVAGVARILSPGGRFCFSHAHVPQSDTFAGDLVPIKTVLNACRQAGLRTYFHQIEDKTNSRGLRQLSHYVGVEKATEATIS